MQVEPTKVPPAIRQDYARVGDLRFHYAESGPANDRLVLLLHGFPEFWYSWRYQIPFLAELGYRVVAPDLRGYNDTDKPRNGYNVATLLRDIVTTEPQNADAHLLLGSILMEQGERTESIAQLSEAVRLRPKSAEAQNALGEAYNTFGDLKSARPVFERAVALDAAFAPLACWPTMATRIGHCQPRHRRSQLGALRSDRPPRRLHSRPRDGRQPPVHRPLASARNR